MKEELKENSIIGQIEFKNPLKTGREEAKKQLREWVEKII